MDMTTGARLTDRIQGLVLHLIGIALIIGGIFTFVIGPIEIYTYSLFIEGGQFYFEGFGFGSLMFGNITVQVAGYYFIALISFPLGYAHLRLLGWARIATLTLIWDWIVLGLPLTIIAYLMLLTSKDLPPSSIPVLILGFVLIYPILPLLLIWFYNSAGLRRKFEASSCSATWIAGKSQITLVVSSLMAFFAMALHLPLLFNGVFPLFDRFISGLNGYLLVDGCILIFAFLAWGVLKQIPLAWSGSVLFLVLMIASAASAFLRVSPAEIFALTNLAEIEREVIKNVPLQGYHLALFFVTPLVICLVLLVASKKHYAFSKPHV